MSISKRLIAIITSGFALAATPEAQAWKEPRPLGPDRPTPGAAGPPPRPGEAETTPAFSPSPASPAPRELIVLTSGFALAAAAVVGVWLLPAADSSPVPGQLATSVAPPPTAAPASGQPAPCPPEPAAAAASEKDGRFPLQGNVEGLIAADITSFIAIGNQAVAAGRPRDAEAAFLMACRVAVKLKGAGSVESADARYQLGAHYAGLALDAAAGAGSPRAELLGRAEHLYADSAQTYRASYGETHEKSQLAAEGLAAVRQALAPTAITVTTSTVAATPVPPPQPAPAPALVPQLATRIEASEKPPALAPPVAVAAATAPAPVPTSAPAASPALVPPLATRIEESEKPPTLAPPVAATAPVPALAVSPLPPVAAQGSSRQRAPVFKECPPAVAVLGLCDSGT